MKQLLSLTFTLLLCPALFGCEAVGVNGVEVGGSCNQNDDCTERCLKGPKFPGGTCSVSCDEDADCPTGSSCVEPEGGVCLMTCTLPDDCRSDYTCKGEKSKGRGGEALVCAD